MGGRGGSSNTNNSGVTDVTARERANVEADRAKRAAGTAVANPSEIKVGRTELNGRKVDVYKSNTTNMSGNWDGRYFVDGYGDSISGATKVTASNLAEAKKRAANYLNTGK